MVVFGCDPGMKSGGVVFREGSRVLAWWAWCPVTRKKQEHLALLSGNGDTVNPPASFETMAELHRVLYSDVHTEFKDHRPVSPMCGVVEQPMSAGKFIATGAFTAQGMMLGVCAIHGVSVDSPLATTWRAQAGIPGGVNATEAEVIALQICLDRTDEEISKVLGKISDYTRARKALAEAWLISKFAST